MVIKYISAQEWIRLKKQTEAKLVYGSTNPTEGYVELSMWDEVSSQQVLVRIAPTPLMAELC